MNTKKKFSYVLLMGVMAFFLGAIAGAVVKILLFLINGGIDLLWHRSGILYNLIVCLIGGLLIGLYQKKFGILPHNMEEVMDTIKKQGKYPYDRLLIISIAAVMPLIFGGALGPEAGLTGIIAGLCCWIGDSLKKRGDDLAGLAETGFAAALSVIFGNPFFGIIGNLEPDNEKEKYREKLLAKRGRVFLYIMGVLGGMAAMMLLSNILGGGGLPRFERRYTIETAQWKWMIPAVLIGVILGFIYLCFDKITGKLASYIAAKRVLSCLIAGACVAIIGYLLPLTMFSGEHQMDTLMETWQSMSPGLLIGSAVLKLLLVNICINFGWKGGSIFPIIFSGVASGYALALIVGVDGAILVALLVAGMYAYINRKPAMAAAILIICFPITYAPFIIAAAIIGAKIPQPNFLKSSVEESINEAQA